MRGKAQPKERAAFWSRPTRRNGIARAGHSNRSIRVFAVVSDARSVIVLLMPPSGDLGLSRSLRAAWSGILAVLAGALACAAQAPAPAESLGGSRTLIIDP